MADYDSRFTGFWTDTLDANNRVEALLQAGDITQDEATQLQHFILDGYVVLPNAITPDLADSIAYEMSHVYEHSDKFVARTERQGYNLATRDVVESRFMRLIDYYVNSTLAREAAFCPKITRFLRLIFERGVMAFQSLSFTVGSQQHMHQDGAYVVLSEPIQFAASWIALQDVEEGTGELEYFPGSHRWPDFLFSGEFKHWKPARDGQEQLHAYYAYLYEVAEKRGVQPQRFLPKKGDALIWAADLAHGGSRITKPEATRRSLVTHYCPEDVLPNYAQETKIFYKKPAGIENCFYSARHYDLRPIMDKPGETLRSPAGEILRMIERVKSETAQLTAE